MDPRARRLIAELGLEPHPEGGYYRELFRSLATVRPEDERGARSALTAIYFLLTAGQVSRWHRVRSDEVWHLYEGGPLELLLADPQLGRLHSATLTQASATHSPVHTVPADWWQAARCVAPYALVGCTVGPGFEFADFSFLREDVDLCERLRSVKAEWLELL
ncbi:MAG: cupin domain-containing protein [Steroidobacteraceae bacterium]